MADSGESHERVAPTAAEVDDEEFDRLIEQSSLGTEGARQLRRRVSDAQLRQVRHRLVGGTDDAS